MPSIVPLQPTPTSRSSSSTGSANAFTTAQTAAAAQPMTSAQLQAALNSMSASIAEQDELVGLQRKLESYAKAHGFANQVKAVVNRRGLVVQVLTDNLLFQSGQATLQAAGLPLLNEVAQLLNVDQTHPITVEGYTDNVPIHSAEFPSNWELSTTRATTVVQYLISRGVNDNRLGAAGYADLHPVASNATAAGRALNRRVDIVIERLNPEPPN
jgi:chemotaxis protein MotB